MKNIVFDMDGILFDTEKVCMDSWCLVAERMNIPDMEKIFPACIGGNEKASEKLLMDFYGPEFPYEQFRPAASAEFRRHINEDGLPIKPGVKECLEYLHSEGYVIGLASSTKKSSVENLLTNAGIRQYFKVLATGDMVTHSKPDPEIYLMACRELQVNPQDTYAVEDSFNGIRSAYAAGLKPLMVPDMLMPDEEMKEKSKAIFKDLFQVRDFLAETER